LSAVLFIRLVSGALADFTGAHFALRSALCSLRRIATGLHYPLPLHLQKAYVHLGYKQGSFPVTEKVAKTLLSLPMPPIEPRTDTICRSVYKPISESRLIS